ncbi:MAG: hypothetical protein HGB16_02075 [Chlorobaculum sp.]|nr:hypothetical protein [Chlorobaculum sp.]
MVWHPGSLQIVELTGQLLFVVEINDQIVIITPLLARHAWRCASAVYRKIYQYPRFVVHARKRAIRQAQEAEGKSDGYKFAGNLALFAFALEQ